MFTCQSCSKTYNIAVKVWPVHCSCGAKTLEDRSLFAPPSNQSTNLPCKFRGDKIGIINCGCAGDTDVMSCQIHEICALRQLKPGTPEIKYHDDRTEKRKPKYCCTCESRVDPDGDLPAV